VPLFFEWKATTRAAPIVTMLVVTQLNLLRYPKHLKLSHASSTVNVSTNTKDASAYRRCLFAQRIEFTTRRKV